MSYVLQFKPAGFPLTAYKEVIKQLDAAGAGSPKGRSYHVCYGDPNNVQVIDVWESMEEFQAFGQTLVPIMQALGADPGSTGDTGSEQCYCRGSSFFRLACEKCL